MPQARHRTDDDNRLARSTGRNTGGRQNGNDEEDGRSTGRRGFASRGRANNVKLRVAADEPLQEFGIETIPAGSKAEMTSDLPGDDDRRVRTGMTIAEVARAKA